MTNGTNGTNGNTECPICILPIGFDEFECPSCEYKTCLECIQTSIHTSGKIECISCHVGFTTQFIHLNFPREFIKNCIDRIHIKKIYDHQCMLIKIEEPLKPLYQEIANVDWISGRDDEYESTLADLHDKVRHMKGMLYGDKTKTKCGGCESGVVFEQDTLCYKCNSDNCIRCGAAFMNGSLHKCRLPDVETLRAIRECSRKCPNCLVWISRIEGCNQMFCIECKTPFDWTSGNVIKRGFFHNPHYHDYLDNGGEAVFNPLENNMETPNGDCEVELEHWFENLPFRDDEESEMLSSIYWDVARLTTTNRDALTHEIHLYDNYDDLRKDIILGNSYSTVENLYHIVAFNYDIKTRLEIMLEFNTIVLYSIIEILNHIMDGELSPTEGLDQIKTFFVNYVKPEFKYLDELFDLNLPDRYTVEGVY